MTSHVSKPVWHSVDSDDLMTIHSMDKMLKHFIHGNGKQTSERISLLKVRLHYIYVGHLYSIFMFYYGCSTDVSGYLIVTVSINR